MFKDFTGSKPKIIISIDKRPDKNKINSAIKFWTLSLPCFNEFRELFYNSAGVKIIPVKLENLLTEKSLAYWLMDDGYSSKNGFYFCTESYSLSENQRLVLIMKNNFDLNCGVHKHTNGYRLYIFSNSKNKLYQLVKPNLLSHFYYKFEIEDKNNEKNK